MAGVRQIRKARGSDGETGFNKAIMCLMKKWLCLFLMLALAISIPGLKAYAAADALPTTSLVLVNGRPVSFDAYNIDGYTYFKLRDLAMALNGTEKQFEVSWNAAEKMIGIRTQTAYTPVGEELSVLSDPTAKPAALTSVKIKLDGSETQLTSYNIGGYHYFQLREIARLINFGVDWDEPVRTIVMDTAIAYTVSKNLAVHFLDVGQGDSAFLILPNHETMLIDAGNEENGPQIVQYIKELGYSQITYLIATHPHADHIGGMAYVIEHLRVQSVYMPKAVTTTQTYERFLTAIRDQAIPVMFAKAGTRMIQSEDLNAMVLAPNREQYEDLNNYSVVVKVSFQNNSFLFMGDAHTLSEDEMSGDLEADVLKVGHHGSDTSTGESFLERVHPHYAVISVGTGNDYGHPAQVTLEKLLNFGVHIFRTDLDGTLVFTSDGNQITIDQQNAGAGIAEGNETGEDPEESSVVIRNVDKKGETVTIENVGTVDLELTGWKLVSVTGRQTYIFPAYLLKAKGTVTVASGSAEGDLKWTTDFVWNNTTSDPAELYDTEGKLISRYDDEEVPS